MFCEVVLSQRFPKSMGIFDYEVPKELESKIKLGHLVTIPFRTSEREGVVVKLKKITTFKKAIKQVTAITQPEPILTIAQLKLAAWMSDYYFVSIGTVIKMMLPIIPKKSRTERATFPAAREIKPSAEIEKITAQAFSGTEPTLLWFNEQSQREDVYYTLFRSKKTVLLLVPTVMEMQKLAGLVPKTLRKKTALVHSKLNKNEYYELYQNILQQKTQIIIGTKIALFMPIPEKTTIVIDQEENSNHKQSDQNPRFDARYAAKHLSTFTKSKLIFVSHAPSVVQYYHNKGSILTVPAESKTDVRTIDMREEFKKQHYSIFSETLTQTINKTLNQKKILLFINKRGTSSSVMCKDCGRTISCDNCSLPLVYHEKDSTLYCHRCNKKSELPPFCPHCNGTDFKFTGTGTQKVEREAKKLWPNVKLARFDKDTDPDASINENDIIVATERVFEYLNWEEIGCVGMVSADTFLYLPDFRSSERTLQLITKIRSFSTPSLIIQTYTPDNQAIKYATKDFLEPFYQSELEDREAVSYPPYAGFIKLVFQHKDKATCLKQAERLYRTFKSSPLHVNIITPLQPYLNGRWRMYLLVRFQDNQKNILPSMMEHVPDSWIIDRDPDTLL